MFDNYNVNIQRAYGLEMWLLENNMDNQNYEDLLNYLIGCGFNQSEIKYLIVAYYIPITDILYELYLYDTVRPKMDEIKFLSDLENKYNCSREIILKRIRYARGIKNFLKKNPHVIYLEDNFMGR